jgi:hypothetical protein
MYPQISDQRTSIQFIGPTHTHCAERGAGMAMALLEGKGFLNELAWRTALSKPAFIS